MAGAIEVGEGRTASKPARRPGGPPSNTLYVTGLPADSSDHSLRRYFETFGTVLGCKVLTKIPGKTFRVAIVSYSTLEEATTVGLALHGTFLEGSSTCLCVTFAERKHSEGEHNFYPRNNTADAQAAVAAAAIVASLQQRSSVTPTALQHLELQALGDIGDLPPIDVQLSEMPVQTEVLMVMSDTLYVFGLPKEIDDARFRNVFEQYGTVEDLKVLPERPDGQVGGLVRYSDVMEASAVKAMLDCNVPQGLDTTVQVCFRAEAEAEAANAGTWSIPSGIVEACQRPPVAKEAAVGIGGNTPTIWISPAEADIRRAEISKRKAAEDTKRSENTAAFRVRKAMHRLRVAGADRIDILRGELARVLAENSGQLGSLCDKLTREVQGALLEPMHKSLRRSDDIVNNPVGDATAVTVSWHS
eukprot:TRINITY_DN48956_c0_g1_i1.p1 TRINITY_DN48956_c0_g1~~TRINITY_DN48956_c0_g1_i1.p1  ORF type:complete len:474 (-),score=83.55 TRINITY_DN48956_c0_g1_i1:114-1361(-)